MTGLRVRAKRIERMVLAARGHDPESQSPAVREIMNEIHAMQHEAMEECVEVALGYTDGGRLGLTAQATATAARIVVEIRARMKLKEEP